jgi:hypothetical protein
LRASERYFCAENLVSQPPNSMWHNHEFVQQSCGTSYGNANFQWHSSFNSRSSPDSNRIPWRLGLGSGSVFSKRLAPRYSPPNQRVGHSVLGFRMPSPAFLDQQMIQRRLFRLNCSAEGEEWEMDEVWKKFKIGGAQYLIKVTLDRNEASNGKLADPRKSQHP